MVKTKDDGEKKKLQCGHLLLFFSFFFSLDIPEHLILRCPVSEKRVHVHIRPLVMGLVMYIRYVMDWRIIICCVTLKPALTVTGLKSGQLGETDVTSLL